MENINDNNKEIIIDIKNIEEESNDEEWIDEEWIDEEWTDEECNDKEWTDEDYRHYKCMEVITLCFIVGLFTGVILFVFVKTALLN